MEAAGGAGKTTDGFRFDLVDVTRQVLANYALVVQQGWVKAFRTGDTTAFNKGCKDFLVLIRDMDRLLATRKDFLLGPWLADARRKGITPEEQDLYESNARDLVTLWGDANSPLHEYSNRQWSGLLSDFYSVRWQQFFDLLRLSRAKGKDPDLAAFEKDISAWEWRWVHQHKKYPVTPSGDAVTEVKKLYKKYRHDIELAYTSGHSSAAIF
jgi:alpha-N-acetylglucosaminidase